MRWISSASLLHSAAQLVGTVIVVVVIVGSSSNSCVIEATRTHSDPRRDPGQASWRRRRPSPPDRDLGPLALNLRYGTRLETSQEHQRAPPSDNTLAGDLMHKSTHGETKENEHGRRWTDGRRLLLDDPSRGGCACKATRVRSGSAWHGTSVDGVRSTQEGRRKDGRGPAVDEASRALA